MYCSVDCWDKTTMSIANYAIIQCAWDSSSVTNQTNIQYSDIQYNLSLHSFVLRAQDNIFLFFFYT